MKVLILAAGYATRLYPITKNFPKPLLEVGGKTVLDHLLQNLRELDVDTVHLVTNSLFADQFRAWSASSKCNRQVDIIDDGTTSSEGRLGAIGDMHLAVTSRDIRDDLLVCAADNIFCFPFSGLVEAFHTHPFAHVCVYQVQSLEKRQQKGNVVLGQDGRILEMREKPRNPKSLWATAPLYIYPASTLPRILEYLNSGESPDAPGHFLEWLCRVEPVYAHPIEGSVLDIGSPESLAEARKRLDEFGRC